MTSATLAARSVEISVEDLQNVGFSYGEIEALSALKAAYPFIEYVDTAAQWRRLLFLKWRYDNGDLKRA